MRPVKPAVLFSLFMALLSVGCAAQAPTADPAVFDYDRDVPLDVVVNARTEHADHTELDLSYRSPAGGRVPALLFLPADGRGPWPAVIVQHGMPGSRRNAASFAAEYARMGAVALAITAPWARPDDEPRRNILTMTRQDADDQIQLIQDLRRAIDLLQARPDVNPDRIAYSGGSYGGAMGGLLAGVEDRIVAYALWVGDGGLVAHVTGPDDARGPFHRMSETQRTAWLRAMEPIEPLRWVGRAAPAELLFQNGRFDEFVPVADAEAYQAAGSEPKTILWYDEGHGLNEEARQDRRRWIMERLAIEGPIE
ncbi:MAG: dienelactone hydrolase family protein [Rhodothermales bacterium]